MKKLEARTMLALEYEYDEEEIEEVLDIWEELEKNVGFVDDRKDKRYIVKFHDIWYYTPDKYDDEKYTRIFDEFCNDMSEYIEEDLKEQNIDLEDVVCTRWNVGHYRAFWLVIPEITEENTVEIASELYDNLDLVGKEYVKNYIYVTKTLKTLEENYMEYWIEFLDHNELVEEKELKEIQEKYEKDKERRNK